ncbi:hypothetical protein [Streptomyces sp. PU-14G]|uniref:hypothetical protein n=1 Tax=Streptomyces sp. PU-14G TaxID=2800808 RepID=UPI0034DFC43A
MADEKAPEQVPGDEATQVLGLVGEPGLGSEVAEAIARRLPPLLRQEADHGGGGRESVRWRVEVGREVLPLDEEGSLPLVKIGQRQVRERGWDAVVVLTEMPRRAGTRPIAADCVPDQGLGLVSLPAMGAFRLRHRTLAVVAHLVIAYLSGDSEAAASAKPPRGYPTGYRAVPAREDNDRTDVVSNVLLDESGVHLTLSGWLGRVRLLAGMVRANRPWRLVPSLSPALAAATAGAAFGIFYSSIWQLADAASTLRLLLVNILAVVAMVAWLVLDNRLWERPLNPRQRPISALYNAATLATVTCGVVAVFALLFSAMFLAACIVVPTGYLARTLGHPAGLSDLATIAWMAACLGTIAGALGSGLAGEDAVRQAAFSRRERERQDRRAAKEAELEQAPDSGTEREKQAPDT